MPQPSSRLLVLSRQETERVEGEQGPWMPKEAKVPNGTETGPKSGAKG